MSHDEYAIEPIRGLPERPPEGEHVIWQGQPCWSALAVRAFHVRKVVYYFGLLWAAFAIFEIYNGHYAAIATTALRLAIPAVLGVFVLTLLAWLYARMTVYTITTHRLVVRSGIALPMTINIPFAQIESAACRRHSDGTTDVPVRVARGQNASYVILWPHVRPWQFRRPEPMMRGLADGQAAVDLLSSALAEHADADSDDTPRIAEQYTHANRPAVDGHRDQAIA